MMSEELIHYYYERTREQQARVLAFNMAFLPVVLWLFVQLTRADQVAYEKFSEIAIYIFVVAEVALLSILVWFLTHPATFYIKLTDSEFSSFHPNFKEWTFSVNPQDIVEIKHRTDSQSTSSLILVGLRNGSSVILSPNFAYNRKELYDALRLVNPNITTPKHTWLFSAKRDAD